MDNQKLNEKLAKWAGLKDVQVFLDHAGRTAKIQFEKPQHSQVYEVTEPFTNSLDACFKWLVPKLSPIYVVTITNHCGYDGWGVELSLIGHNSIFYSEDRTPALGLCLAIEKLIDEG